MPSSGALGVLTASVTTDTTSTGLGGVVTWNYSVAASDVEYLAKNQTKVEQFTITLNDGNGGTINRTIEVTITGTNDDPVVATSDLNGAVIEAVTPAGNLTDTGTIAFTDVDLTDTHIITTIAPSSGALGTPTASVTTDTTSTGLGGVVTWNYSVAASAVEYLAKNQTRVQQFTITLDDGNGGIINRTIEVTITGTNDDPVVATSDLTGTVLEAVAPAGNLTDTGTITFTDVDLTDAHVITTIAPSSGALGTLTASVTTDTTGSGLGGVVTWNYSVAASDVEYLAKNQTRVQQFTITLDDGNGGIIDRIIEVTITGTNDAPVVAVALTDNAYEGDTAFTTDLLAGATDIDLGETATLSIDNLQYSVDGGTASTILPAGVSLGSDGHTLTIDPTDPAFDYLASGDQTVIVISYGVEDAQGATVTQIETVTIHGTNDVPAIAGVATGDVTEDVAVDNTDHINTTGLLTIADADTGQSSFTAQASTTGSNNYGSFTLAANGTWTYTADNTQAAIQELGANEFITDSFVAVSSDGTASELVTVTIHGTNDVPTIAGDVTVDVAVDNDGHINATGQLTIADADAGQFNFAAQTDTAGSSAHGTFALAANGTWTYTADNTQAEIQQLDVSEFLTDTFTAFSFDGTANQLVTVTIHGTAEYLLVA